MSYRPLERANICTECGADNASPVRDGDGQPTGALCTACWNASVAARRTARKAELAALPRCALCRRRGSWRIGLAPTVLVCGAHRNAANRELARRLAPVASIAMFTDTRQSGEAILAMLKDAK